MRIIAFFFAALFFTLPVFAQVDRSSAGMSVRSSLNTTTTPLTNGRELNFSPPLAFPAGSIIKVTGTTTDTNMQVSADISVNFVED